VAYLRVRGTARKRIQEISFSSDQDRSGKFAAHKKGMSIVRCLCGFEILVLPDLKAMNRAINNHVAEHKKASDGSPPDSLEQFLTEQVLIVTGKNAVNLKRSGVVNRKLKFPKVTKSRAAAV
jgi:hypothetical protein